MLSGRSTGTGRYDVTSGAVEIEAAEKQKVS